MKRFLLLATAATCHLLCWACAAVAFGQACGTGTTTPVASTKTETRPHSSFRIEKNGHGKGRDLVVLTWRTTAGQRAGLVKISITGNGRIGPVSLEMEAIGATPNASEWDTREWQWWKDYPFDLNQMRPREVAPATGGGDVGQDGVRIWTRFVCDDVETIQEWFFRDLERADDAVYDCLITIRNLRKQTLEEYGQFFASYTAWNQQSGHLYWNADGGLTNYRAVGSRHLDYYVTDKDSMFQKLGRVPHCPRGGGKVRATWKHPVSVSLPGSHGHRHVLMTEEASTAAIAQGMQGIAQDFLVYPPAGRLKSGDSFRTHVRHLVTKAADNELPEKLERWWTEFSRDHERIRKLSRSATEKD